MPLAPGSVVADDFKVLRPLSSSAYVVEQISTGSERVLKLLDPELVHDPLLRKRFEKEVRVGLQIESDHVVLVVAAGIDDALEAPWIATELLEGEDLGARVARASAMSLAEARPIFLAIGDAVGAAHNIGIVHGDLKPQNVFLGKTLKVLDFGIAKLAAEAGLEPKGQPLWKAPEQLGDGEVTPATDVWSLGLLAFFALTGRPYWQTANAAGAPNGKMSGAALLLEITDGALEPASLRAAKLGASLPQTFDAWFARAVARDPGARFTDASEACAALAKALVDAPPARKKSALAAAGTVVMADAPQRPPSEPPAAAFVPAPAAEPAANDEAANDAKTEKREKRKKPPSTERTMTLGLGVAPGFSAEDIIERDTGRRPKRSGPPPADDPNIVPSELSSRASPAPPAIPLPGPRGARASSADPREAESSKSRTLPWVLGLAFLLAASAGGAYAVVQLSRAPAAPSATAEDPSRRAAAAELETKRREEGERVAAEQKKIADERQAEIARRGVETGNAIAMVAFEGATFVMGSQTGTRDEQPPHEVTLAPFALDKSEVTSEAYNACVEAGRCGAAGAGDACNGILDERKKHPINCVDFAQAKAYCAWRGHRLPTEAEWEYASALGGAPKKPYVPSAKPRRYPWGDAPPEKQLCLTRCGEGTCPTGTFPAGDTPQGLKDLAGNVAEWTDALFCPYRTPECGELTRVVRGGAWCGSEANDVRSTARAGQDPSTRSSRIGVRCARDGAARP